MSEKVIDIRSKLPHMQGKAFCLECKHEWQAVSEIGVYGLTCPKCECGKGVYKNIVAPEEGWICICGNALFFITKKGCLCSYCGLTQEF